MDIRHHQWHPDRPNLFTWVSKLRAISSQTLFIIFTTVLCGLYAAGWIASEGLLRFFPDSWGYLKPAIAALAGEEFASNYGRSFGYPLLLIAVIDAMGIEAIAMVQAGLLTASIALMAATWWLLPRGKGPHTPVRDGLYVLAGSALVLGLATYQPLANYAVLVMPEVFYVSLASLVMCLVVLACSVDLSKRWFIVVFFGAMLVSVLNFYVKPHWAAALAFTGVCLIWRLVLRTDFTRWQKVATVIVTIAIATVALVLPNAQFTKNDPASKLFAPLTLFCNFADLISPQLRQEAAATGAIGLAEVADRLDAVVSSGPDAWVVHGFNADLCLYDQTLIGFSANGALLNRLYPKREDLVKFALRSVVLGVLAHPVEYLGKVVKQLSLAITDPFAAYSSPGADDGVFYAEIAGYPYMEQHPVRESMRSGLTPQPLRVFSLPLSWLGDKAFRVFNVLVPFGVAAALLLLAVRASQALARRSIAPLKDELGLLLVYGFYFASLIVVGLSHTFDIARYREAAAPMALISTMFVFWRVADMAWAIAGRYNSRFRKTKKL